MLQATNAYDAEIMPDHTVGTKKGKFMTQSRARCVLFCMFMNRANQDLRAMGSQNSLNRNKERTRCHFSTITLAQWRSQEGLGG